MAAAFFIAIAASLLGSACTNIPELPQSCAPTDVRYYHPDPSGSGGGRVETVYTGPACPTESEPEDEVEGMVATSSNATFVEFTENELAFPEPR